MCDYLEDMVKTTSDDTQKFNMRLDVQQAIKIAKTISIIDNN